MKLSELFENADYNNWVKYTEESARADYDEYMSKEQSKWKSRAKTIGSRFPIFDSFANFKEMLEHAKVVNIDVLGDVANLTKNHSIDDIKSMVSSYYMPRDVDRIVRGLKNNVPMPLPIIIQGSKGMWILAGNTRQSTARVLGYTPKALLVNVI